MNVTFIWSIDSLIISAAAILFINIRSLIVPLFHPYVFIRMQLKKLFRDGRFQQNMSLMHNFARFKGYLLKVSMRLTVLVKLIVIKKKSWLVMEKVEKHTIEIFSIDHENNEND